MDLVTRLSYLFGTEEDVRHRRQLVLLREKILTLNIGENAATHSVICSGSLGEGVSYPPSDDDLMFISQEQSWLVYDSYEEAIQQNGLFMIPSEYSPGFCIIQDVRQSRLTAMSSKEFRDDFVQRMGFTPHGPCASTQLGLNEYDHAKCLLSPHWPVMANEWISRRRRYGSPSRELIETIVSSGCHIVPIGNPESPLCDYEWRISFSFAERHLIHNFNHVQFLMYNLLKLILKRVIDRESPSVLCSYFLKTVLFYAIENTPLELWVNVTVEECYRKCLTLLYYFIDEMNCPNYFVPGNNMMKRKVNIHNKVPLLMIVSELFTRGIVGSLYLCNEFGVLSPQLSTADIELKSDAELLLGYQWFITLVDCKIFIQSKMETYSTGYSRNILLSLATTFRQVSGNCRSGILKIIFRQILTYIRVNFLRKTSCLTQGNKYRYQTLEYGQVLINIGCSSDISSGRLHLATYMFMTGRIHHCLEIVKLVLSNFAPYVMSEQYNDAAEEMYKQVICNNDYSLDYKAKTAWAFDIDFEKEYAAYVPIPVRILLAQMNRQIPLPSIPYAHLLQGLCFYHTRDMTSMNSSVTLLADTVRGLPSRCLLQTFYGRFLLGYMKMLQQDYHSSFCCLTAAYLMRDDLEKKFKFDYQSHAQACAILLACVLNRSLH